MEHSRALSWEALAITSEPRAFIPDISSAYVYMYGARVNIDSRILGGDKFRGMRSISAGECNTSSEAQTFISFCSSGDGEMAQDDNSWVRGEGTEPRITCHKTWGLFPSQMIVM